MWEMKNKLLDVGLLQSFMVLKGKISEARELSGERIETIYLGSAEVLSRK